MKQTAGTKRYLGVGLQIKAGLIVTLVIVLVTAAAGWFYMDNTAKVLREADIREARNLAQSISLAASGELQQHRPEVVQRLAEGLLEDPKVRYVTILSRQGEPVATASRDIDPQAWRELRDMPISVLGTQQPTPNLLLLAGPIVSPKGARGSVELVGGVRLVLNTAPTTDRLAEVQKRVVRVAVALALGGIPLSYLLVWRVLIQPLRRLARVTAKLARGQWGARCNLKRNDEIGALGAAFDEMAGEIGRSHKELKNANAQLEQKVAERTLDLRKANQRLRDEMSEKEEFLRAVSHDLNAPLRNIGGMATMAMMKWREVLPEDVLARLQRIQANVDLETSLISDLLELSRIRTRRQRREDVDVAQLVEELRGAFEFELKSRDIELAVRGPLPTLRVERSRLRGALQNLIDNAIKYMHRPHGGKIEVGYDRREEMHDFYVRDNGPGIRQDDQQRIFCVFRRGETAANVQGKGVGLAVVKSIAATYQGKAWVESQPGQGATFHLSLHEQCTGQATNEEAADEVLASASS